MALCLVTCDVWWEPSDESELELPSSAVPIWDWRGCARVQQVLAQAGAAFIWLISSFAKVPWKPDTALARDRLAWYMASPAAPLDPYPLLAICAETCPGMKIYARPVKMMPALPGLKISSEPL